MWIYLRQIFIVAHGHIALAFSVPPYANDPKHLASLPDFGRRH